MRAATCLVTVALALVPAIGGCGGGDSGSGPGGTTKVVVGAIPIADVAPLYLGVHKGFFRKEGLDVKVKSIEGGASAVPAVLTNEIQFAFGNAISLLQARERNIDFRIVTEGVQGGSSNANSSNAIMVKKGSSIRSPGDLAGKTVAVNTLRNLGEVTVKGSLEKHGVDPSTLKFVEVPFPDMNAALDRGSVDAIWTVEPFIAQGLAAGDRKLLDPFVELTPRLTPAQYFGSAKYLDSHPDVEKGFRRAMNRSLDYAQGHQAAVRGIIPTYSAIPKPVAQKMPLPYWTAHLNVGSVRLLARLSKKYGVIKKDPDVDAILPKQ